MKKPPHKFFKREGLYEQVCVAAGVVPRTKNIPGYLSREELMQILLKLKKGRISCNLKK